MELSPVQTISFFTLFKRFFIILFVIIICFQAIQVSIENRSLMSGVKLIGDQFIYTTQNLDNYLQKLISEGGVYNSNDSFWIKLKDNYLFYSQLYTSFFIIYLWLAILTWIFRTLFTNSISGFTAFLLALGVFICLQSFIITITAAISKQIDCFNGCKHSAVYYMKMPVNWIIDIVKIIPNIGQKASKQALDTISSIAGNNTYKT